MATILCVEPDPPLGDLLTCALRRDGCTVLEEEAGAPVPRLVRYGAVDLVVLDLALPDQPCLAVLAVRASTEGADPAHGHGHGAGGRARLGSGRR